MPRKKHIILGGIAFILVMWGFVLAVMPSLTGHMTRKKDSEKTDNAYWKSILSPDQYRVCRLGGTERAFSGEYLDYKGSGIFHCIACGVPLFEGSKKYDSKTGWPSFWDTAYSDNIELVPDLSFGLERTEVKCKHCGAHLGHIFNDGPAPTHKRYCINSVCLLLKEE